MSVEENKALTRQFFEELNKGNLSVWDDLYAPGYVYHTTSGDMTAEQSKHYDEGLFAAFPDLNISIEDMFAEGDSIVVRYTLRATHQGAFRGIAPTGKRIMISGIEIDRLAGGKFTETWSISDTFGLMQ
jgi:predicted ester cyclase